VLAHCRVDIVEDPGTFGDEDGLQAVFATAVGEDGVFHGEFAEDWRGRIEAENWEGGLVRLSFLVW
jgi:hypothetical protein